VDETVEEEENPDRRAHVLDSNKETSASTHVMVGLQGRTLLALQENDGGVDEFVEFGDVEPPAVKGKTFVPETTNVVRVRKVGGGCGLDGARDERVGVEPGRDGGAVVVDCSVAESTGTGHPAKRIHGSPESVRRSEGVLETSPSSSHNTNKGPGRVNSNWGGLNRQ
jgi:hypothetical protein